MKAENFLTTLKYVAKRLGIAEIVILVLTGLVCWWLGSRTLAGYSTGLILVGLAVMIFATFSFSGGTQLQLNDNFEYQYSKSVMPGSENDRAQQTVKDMATGCSFATWAFMAGVLTIAMGLVLKVFLALTS